MADVIQLEWLNQNSLRNYPIRENAQRRPSLNDGTLVDEYAIPNYLITDFVMTIDNESSSALYIMKMILSNSALTFIIGSEGDVAATVSVDLTTHKTNDSYTFRGLNSYASAIGCMVVGDTARLREDIPDGVYSYTYTETCFEYRCVRPAIRRVSSLCIYDDQTGYSTKQLYGKVRLIAGDNIILRYDEENNGIRIDADSSKKYNEECECGAETTVKTINGLSVENVTLVGDDCISVTTDGTVIKISDTCSKPCCGCAEMNFLNEKLSQLNTAVNKLENYADALDSRISELHSAYQQANTDETDGDVSNDDSDEEGGEEEEG